GAALAIGELHLHRTATGGGDGADVIVGQDVAVRPDDLARPGAGAAGALGGDRHHRRNDLVGDRGHRTGGGGGGTRISAAAGRSGRTRAALGTASHGASQGHHSHG